jgi:hypothetical protein
MAPRTKVRAGSTDEKVIPSIVNAGYFSDYYLGYRLDSGLANLYGRWDAAEKTGDPTARTRIRALGSAFDAHRVDAALTAPGQDALDEGRLDPGVLPADAVEAQEQLNDKILEALGWKPHRGDAADLTTGEQTLTVPVAHHADTHSGTLLLALDGVFSTDPAAVAAGKEAPAGRLLAPLELGGKPAAHTALQAAQLIFTADDPPNYLLIVSGGSITLLDRDRWGEGVFLGANLDDAIARHDDKPKGELAAIAALFSADSINPGVEAQSVLSGLLEKAASESAGVSKDLRHGMRRSVELLANTVVADMRERQKVAWTTIAPADLTRQCLRYLYRIVVLLFAEARPELGILPADDPDYQSGYSIARLRDIALVELQSDHARKARHIQQSLDVLFRVVNEGHKPDMRLGDDSRDLEFPGLRSTLFGPHASPLVDRAHLPDEVLQQVLAHLCFTRERAGARRQSVSYSTLGVNQLGAVYEGLMAYSGFVATEPLFEVDKDADPDNGSWVIPVTRADEFPDEVFLKEPGPDGTMRRVQYREGDFVYRLSGRDRQRSASYYTPEILTEFTVRHALDVYFEENPDLTAADLLELTICEPALGSGAFANEAINQVAARYLKLAHDALGETIDADQYQRELQKVKAHFAVNQVYGVDLNQTAVDLAEVSLWLNCMHPGLDAPWFGARLRRGNSLIGARRATYTAQQVREGAYMGKNAPAPVEQPLAEIPAGSAVGIHHFLVPGQGWGAAADASELKELAQDWVASVKGWRTAIAAKPNDRQLRRLDNLAGRIEDLWRESLNEVAQFWGATRQHVDVWGHQTPPTGTRFGEESIRRVLHDPRSASYRLRTVMNAWCSLWMWGPEHGTDLPDWEEWLSALEELTRVESRPFDPEVLFADERELDLRVEERTDADDTLARFPWLAACEQIADRQAWFHWELEFSPVFTRGGFDLQVGNPPWVRPRWADEDSLAEFDPWFGITDPIPEAQRKTRRAAVLSAPTALAKYLAERSENTALNTMMGAGTREPLLVGQQNNLYLLFITGTWSRCAPSGSVALVHPGGHLSDPKAGSLRAKCYRRLRRHWHFINELKLFHEISNTREYGIQVYSDDRGRAAFVQAAFLYHPGVVDRSRDHDGTGELPGRKHPTGEWDMRPHRERLVSVTDETLISWAQLLAAPDPAEAPLVKTVTSAEAAAAEAIARYPHRLVGTKYFWTAGWHEQTAPRSGIIEERTDQPSSWDDVVLSGPHIGICNPFAKESRSGRSQRDYEPFDLVKLPESVIPRTNWQRVLARAEFDALIDRWDGEPHTTRYRIIARRQVPSNTYRSVFMSLLPPKPTAVSVCYLGGLDSDAGTGLFVGLASSLLVDFFVRVSGPSDLHDNVVARFPVLDARDRVADAVLHRTLRLNCLTTEYSSLWNSLSNQSWASDELVAGTPTRGWLGAEPKWSMAMPARTDLDRWLLLSELDALGALGLGVPVQGLSAIYRSQFPVLRTYEYQMVFDARGNQICGDWHQYGLVQARWEAEYKEAKLPRGTQRMGMWDRVQAYLTGDTAVDLGPFVPPFVPADREKAMTTAYWAFVDRYGLTPPDLAERPA